MYETENSTLIYSLMSGVRSPHQKRAQIKEQDLAELAVAGMGFNLTSISRLSLFSEVMLYCNIVFLARENN